MKKNKALFDQKGNLRLIWKFLGFLITWQLLGVSLIRLITPSIQQNEFLMSSLFNSIIAISVAGALTISAKFLERKPMTYYGLGINRSNLSQTGIGLLTGGAIITLLVFGLVISGSVVNWLPKTEFTNTTLPLSIIGQVFRYLAGAFFEEALTSALLVVLAVEAAKKSKASSAQANLLALIISALVFGAMHAFSPNATMISTVNLSLFGAITTLSFLATRNLGFSIGFHASWNISQNNIYGMENSGQESLVKLFQINNGSESHLITGGSFGIEGSLLTTLVLGTTLMLAWKKTQSYLQE